MESGEAIDIVRTAIVMAMTVGLPLLAVGLVVGLVVSIFQAVTQIQDQTVSAVPKIIAMVLALIVCLPWIVDRMVEHTKSSIRQIPAVIRQ